MSVGLSLIAAIVVAGSRSHVRRLGDDWFSSAERPLWEWVSNYYRRYGAVPARSVVQQAGFLLPEAEASVDFYMERVKRRQILESVRGDWTNLTSAYGSADEEQVIAILERMLRGALHFRASGDLTTLAELADQVLAEYMRDHLHPGLRGVTTGWDYLDELTLGLQGGDIFTVVARPNIGKSYTLLWMALRAWLAGHSVLFATMEMSLLQTARRLLAMYAGVDVELFRRGRLSDETMTQVHEQFSAINDGPPFHMIAGDFRKSTADIDSLISELSPAVVYVDASYLLQPERKGARTRWEIVTQVGEELKASAMRRDVPLVQSVQFNRASNQRDDGGDLDTIGGGDVIGQISSIVLSLREGEGDREHDTRRYKLLKNRDGRKGEFVTTYRFDPFDMSLLSFGGANPADWTEPPPNMEWM